MSNFMDSIKDLARRLSRSVRAFIHGITSGVSEGVKEVTGKRDEKIKNIEDTIVPPKGKSAPPLNVYKDKESPALNIFKGDPDLTVFKNSQAVITQSLPPTSACNSPVAVITPINLEKPKDKKPSYAEVALKAVNHSDPAPASKRRRMG